MKSSIVYFAAPYSHSDRSVCEARVKFINEAASILMSEGLHLFSPISHTHPIAMAGSLPTGFDYWESYDTAILSACGALIVLELSGWQDSVGVRGEIAIARRLGLPIFYVRFNTSELREVAHRVLEIVKEAA